MNLSGKWLAIDASCSSTQVAIIENGTTQHTIKTIAPAMESLMGSVKQACDSEGTSIRDFNGFIYCSGPGSILGIRLSIMAIKTWSNLYSIPSESILSYDSLSMACATVRKQQPTINSTNDQYIVCSEWKKDHWNVIEASPRSASPEIEVWNTQKLQDYANPKYILQQRKLWNQSVENLNPVTYSIADIPELSDLKSNPQWSIYNPDPKQYATWSGERHRAE